MKDKDLGKLHLTHNLLLLFAKRALQDVPDEIPTNETEEYNDILNECHTFFKGRIPNDVLYDSVKAATLCYLTILGQKSDELNEDQNALIMYMIADFRASSYLDLYTNQHDVVTDDILEID